MKVTDTAPSQLLGLEDLGWIFTKGFGDQKKRPLSASFESSARKQPLYNDYYNRFCNHLLFLCCSRVIWGPQ